MKHRRRRFAWALVLVAMPALAVSQDQGLYVMTGGPVNGGYSPLHEPEIFKVDPGPLKVVRRLRLSGKGIGRVLPDYGGGALFICSPFQEPALEVVRFSDPISTRLRRPLAEAVPAGSWRYWPSTGRGGELTGRPTNPAATVFSLRHFLGRTGADLIVADLLVSDMFAFVTYTWNASLSKLMPRSINASSIAGVRVSGEFGFAKDGYGDSDELFIFHEGGNWHTESYLGTYTLNLPVPPAFPRQRSSWRLMAANEHATLIRLDPRSQQPAALLARGASHLRLYRETSKEWEPFDTMGSEPQVRLIGPWLLMIVGTGAAGARLRRQRCEVRAVS